MYQCQCGRGCAVESTYICMMQVTYFWVELVNSICNMLCKWYICCWCLQKARGCLPSSAHKWQDTRHIEHFRQAPDTYNHFLENFLLELTTTRYQSSSWLLIFFVLCDCPTADTFATSVRIIYPSWVHSNSLRSLCTSFSWHVDVIISRSRFRFMFPGICFSAESIERIRSC